MLFNEPKLLKFPSSPQYRHKIIRFSALQRAEIAEMVDGGKRVRVYRRFSALQRAEIAEIQRIGGSTDECVFVSVLFNEPKLLKYGLTLEEPHVLAEFQCSSTSRNC